MISILDYCKTTACSIGVIPQMNALLLCTVIDHCVQEDSKLGQLIYPLQRVILMKFMQNEQI